MAIQRKIWACDAQIPKDLAYSEAKKTSTVESTFSTTTEWYNYAAAISEGRRSAALVYWQESGIRPQLARANEMMDSYTGY